MYREERGDDDSASQDTLTGLGQEIKKLKDIQVVLAIYSIAKFVHGHAIHAGEGVENTNQKVPGQSKFV